MAPTNTPATIIGIVGAILTLVGVGFLVADQYTPGTAVTVVGLVFVVVAMGTLTHDTPADAKPPSGGGRN